MSNRIRTAAQQIQDEMSRAKIIKRTLGTRAGAGYLRNRGYSLEEALSILLGKVV